MQHTEGDRPGARSTFETWYVDKGSNSPALLPLVTGGNHLAGLKRNQAPSRRPKPLEIRPTGRPDSETHHPTTA